MANASTAGQADGYSPNLATWRQRRAAVRRIISQLDEIMDNEIRYRDNIPDELLGSEVFETADYSVTLLDEAIEILESVYHSQA